MEIDFDKLTDEEKIKGWNTLVQLTRSKTASTRPEFQMIAKVMNMMLRSAVALSSVFETRG